MYKARYYKTDGSKGRARALPDTPFDGVVNEGVLHQAVKAYMANQRQGTAAAKSRGQVRGGGRKPFRQKGTGRARQGTIRAAHMAGGGRAFPPIPHSWRQQLPRKVRALAKRSAFNARAEEERVVLIDALDFDAPKTARLIAYLASIGLEGKTLILTDGVNTNVRLSARNLSTVEVRSFGEESVYDILWARTVLIERSALEAPKAKATAAKAKPATEVEEVAAATEDESEEDDDA